MVKSVKHKDVKTFVNKKGIYVTCNELTYFGREQPNVDRRITVFHTTEIPGPKTEAPEWIENNPMECLIWIINEINRNISYVPKNKRFYDKSIGNLIIPVTN